MIIIDTSVWIEFLKGNEEVSGIMKSYLKRREVYGLSSIFGELLQGVKNKKERLIIEGFWLALPKISEKDLFIEAGRLSNSHNLISKGVGLIDAYIIAAGMVTEAPIWSLDKKLNRVMQTVFN